MTSTSKLYWIALAILVPALATNVASAGLIVSEDWESYSLTRAHPDLDGWDYVQDVASSSWNQIPDRGLAWIGNHREGDTTLPSAYSGEQFVELNASYLWRNTGKKFVSGVTYELETAATAGVAGEGLYLYIADHNPVEAPDLGTSRVVSFFNVPDSNYAWSPYGITYTATADDAGKDIVIAMYGRAATFVDNVKFASSAPEPASLTLAGIGLLGMAYVGWRRRR
jgi:MYXO-CTERM domain-containing protein